MRRGRGWEQSPLNKQFGGSLMTTDYLLEDFVMFQHTEFRTFNQDTQPFATSGRPADAL